ncbi:hypothetical protein RJT34_01486 [Clitoria ternatea]|uniref:Secreted protein n=1 Tax=Clitoria ternatea TaxID=43366 RepID=A0AAN9PYJ8_CLITE
MYACLLIIILMLPLLKTLKMCNLAAQCHSCQIVKSWPDWTKGQKIASHGAVSEPKREGDRALTTRPLKVRFHDIRQRHRLSPKLAH